MIWYCSIVQTEQCKALLVVNLTDVACLHDVFHSVTGIHSDVCIGAPRQEFTLAFVMMLPMTKLFMFKAKHNTVGLDR